jgi:hypothetical protein
MEPPAPRGFWVEGRKKAKAVADATDEPSDEPFGAKSPGPSGRAVAGARFVAPLGRCYGIALRAAPGGSHRHDATQTIPSQKEML